MPAVNHPVCAAQVMELAHEVHPHVQGWRGGLGANDGKLRNLLRENRMLPRIGDVTISQEKAHFSASKAKYWRAFLNLKMTTLSG